MYTQRLSGDARAREARVARARRCTRREDDLENPFKFHGPSRAKEDELENETLRAPMDSAQRHQTPRAPVRDPVWVYEYVYIYIYIWRMRERDRERERDLSYDIIHIG